MNNILLINEKKQNERCNIYRELKYLIHIIKYFICYNLFFATKNYIILKHYIKFNDFQMNRRYNKIYNSKSYQIRFST